MRIVIGLFLLIETYITKLKTKKITIDIKKLIVNGKI